MKTIQTVARYFPEKCGGIQIRLSELLPVLKTYGVDSIIAAPVDGAEAEQYEYKGTSVYRYPVSPIPKPEPNYGLFPHSKFEIFARWLKEQKADVYHQHQWTPTCGLPHLRLAKSLGMSTIVSIRLPEPICQRQTLMFKDQEACSGQMDVTRCSQCCGVSEQISPEVLETLSYMPMPVSLAARGLLRRVHKLPQAIANPLHTGLSAMSVPAFVRARHHGLLEMARYADRIVTLSQRLHDMLVMNGVPSEKLVICHTGLDDAFVHQKPEVSVRPGPPYEPLRVLFLGRWHPTKGIHILVEAIKSLPRSVPIELTIHAIQNVGEYQQEVIKRIGNDPRIKVKPQLSRAELPHVLANYDVLALPAQWFDVRPMAIIEAHAFGLPVLGADMGGIPELIRHRVDGLLVPQTDVSAWAMAIAELALNPSLLAQLRQGIRPVRTVSMEAADLATLYRSLMQERSAQSYAIAENLQLQPQ